MHMRIMQNCTATLLVELSAWRKIVSDVFPGHERAAKGRHRCARYCGTRKRCAAHDTTVPRCHFCLLPVLLCLTWITRGARADRGSGAVFAPSKGTTRTAPRQAPMHQWPEPLSAHVVPHSWEQQNIGNSTGHNGEVDIHDIFGDTNTIARTSGSRC